MARKKAQQDKAQAEITSAPADTSGDVVPSASVSAPEDDEPVKINNASLQEMRYAVEDSVKEFFSKQGSYDASHTHEDVHLTLGWICVFVSGATSLYAWYTPFAESKQITLYGVVLYFVVAGLNWLWDNLVVKNAVFVGSRQTFKPKSRIQTETLTIHSKQLHDPVEDPRLQLRADFRVTAEQGKVVILNKTQERPLSFTEVFDSEGQLHKDKLASILDVLEKSLSS